MHKILIFLCSFVFILIIRKMTKSFKFIDSNKNIIKTSRLLNYCFGCQTNSYLLSQKKKKMKLVETKFHKMFLDLPKLLDFFATKKIGQSHKTTTLGVNKKFTSNFSGEKRKHLKLVVTKFHKMFFPKTNEILAKIRPISQIRPNFFFSWQRNSRLGENCSTYWLSECNIQGTYIL